MFTLSWMGLFELLVRSMKRDTLDSRGPVRGTIAARADLGGTAPQRHRLRTGIYCLCLYSKPQNQVDKVCKQGAKAWLRHCVA